MIVLVLYTLLLFALFFILKRRAGLLVLGMAAATMLADQIYLPIARFLAATGFGAGTIPLTAVVYIAIVLIVTISLIGRSKKNHSLVVRIVHAGVLSALFVLLTYGVFRQAVVLDTASTSVDALVRGWRSVGIAACIGFAVLDVWFYHSHHGHHEKK